MNQHATDWARSTAVMLALAAICVADEPVTVPPVIEQSRIHVVPLGELPTVRPGNRLLITPLYAASLNPETKFADWVRYRVTAATISTDNVLARNWRTGLRDDALESSDYDGSGYDRGHLVPLASFAGSRWAWTVNRMEVVAPQRPALNQGPWLAFEAHVRDLARSDGPVIVTVWTTYGSDMGTLPQADEPHRIPSGFACRVETASGRRAWYLMPQKAVRSSPLGRFEVTQAEFARGVVSE